MSVTKVDAEDDPFQTAVPGRKREFLSFLKSIRSFKGDLSSFTAPAFLLSPISLTEHPTAWAEPSPALLLAPANEPDPAARALLVLKWYLASLREQFPAFRQNRRKKKPLNPFLGELFLGTWDDEDSEDTDGAAGLGKTQLVVEQVSHHPPVSAFRIENKRHGVRLEGYYAQKTYFAGGTVRIERIGHVLVHVDAFDEDYVMTQPRVRLEGLLPPPPYPEVEDSCRIVSSSGFVGEIEYSGRGWVRGKKNSFTAKIYRAEESEKVVFSAEGQWNQGSFVVRDGDQNVLETIDTTTPRTIAVLKVKPVEEQDPLESRRAWFHVARGIEAGDMATVAREKSRIEEQQRAMRKTELIEEREWQTRHFERAESWPAVEDLLGKIGLEIERDKTKGIWRWIEPKDMNGSV